MRVVHEIFHAMFESKEGRLSWSIHISTEIHGKVLKIIACLDSDVHEATKPVIDKKLCEFSICFSYSPIRGAATKSTFSKDESTGKGYL